MKNYWFSFFSAFGLLFALFSAVPAQAGIVRDSPSYHTVWIISVGIDQYRGVKFGYCVADAAAVTEAIGKPWKAAGIKVERQTLTDAEATPERIRAAFASVAAHAQRDDLFVFFFAGVSVVSRPNKAGESQYYLLTSSCSVTSLTDLGNYDNPVAQAISGTQLRRFRDGIQAHNQLYIFDAGVSHDKMRAFADRTADASPLAQSLDDRSVVLLTSMGVGAEDPKLKHGILTSALLDGLAGKAKLVTDHPELSCRELEAYLPARLLVLSQGSEFYHEEAVGENFTVLPPPLRSPLAGTRRIQPDFPSEAAPLVPAKGRDYALLIATDRYEAFSALANPIHDAEALGAELKTHYGFEVELLKNPKREEIQAALLRYRNKPYLPGDQLLIYIAGHGMKSLSDGDGDIVASDSRAFKDDPFEDTFLSETKLNTNLVSFPCAHILLALDVCYGGQFAPKSTADTLQQTPVAEKTVCGTLWHLASDDASLSPLYDPVEAAELLARLMKSRTRQVLSSTGDAPAPDGDPGDHSPFVRRLLGALQDGERKPVITAHDLYQSAVASRTAPTLSVFDNAHPDGDFVFVPKRSTPSKPLL